MPHDLFEVWGCFIPTACIFRCKSTCCPLLTRMKEFRPYISYISGSSSALQLPYLSASTKAKNVFSSLLLASFAVILFYFGFFPNYSLLTIFILHPEIVSQSTSWERIPSCDNQATSSTMESLLSLFLERVSPSSQGR